MRHPAYWALVEKSRAACVTAVETFNRVSAPYRAENFAILMINAWELLLKARVVKENNSKISSIYAKERIKLKNGKHGKRLVNKLTRYGSPYTISITDARDIVQGYSKDHLEPIVAANITALLDIRDHATHFVASSTTLQMTLNELSLAAVRNYIIMSQKWFGMTYADLNLAAIPISFSLNQTKLEAVAKSHSVEVARFLAHIKAEETKMNAMVSDCSYSITVNFDIVKKKTDGAVTALIVGPKDNPEITVAYEANKVPDGFEWDYDMLNAKLAARYSNFKINNSYHKIRKILEINQKLCHERYLNPAKKKGTKRFYNINILKEFDAHYQKIS